MTATGFASLSWRILDGRSSASGLLTGARIRKNKYCGFWPHMSKRFCNRTRNGHHYLHRQRMTRLMRTSSHESSHSALGGPKIQQNRRSPDQRIREISASVLARVGTTNWDDLVVGIASSAFHRTGRRFTEPDRVGPAVGVEIREAASCGRSNCLRHNSVYLGDATIRSDLVDGLSVDSVSWKVGIESPLQHIPFHFPRSLPSMADPNLSSFIWSVADLLRGDYKQSEYGKVILPFTVLRRLDCVLEATKADVLKELATREKAGLNPEPFLLRKSGQLFFNTSPLDMKKLMGDQDHRREPASLPAGASHPPYGTSLNRSTSTRRSTGWPKSGCCIWWQEVRQYRPTSGSGQQFPDGTGLQ